MEHNCAKCGLLENGSTHIEGGETYYFCKYCTKAIAEMNRTGNVIHDFLQDKESWVMRNIRLAKERRAKGINVWKKD